MPSIEIDYPGAGNIVSRQFTAEGLWTLDAAGTPAITCELRPETGDPVATVTAVVTGAPGTAGAWSAQFVLTSDHNNMTLVAQIDTTAASDSQSDLTVQDVAPLELDPMPLFPGSPLPPAPPVGTAAAAAAAATAVALAAAPVNYDVSGTYDGGIGVTCVAAAVRPNGQWKKPLLDAKEATLNNDGTWTCRLRINASQVPVGTKVAVLAALVNNKGRVSGRASRRKKAT